MSQMYCMKHTEELEEQFVYYFRLIMGPVKTSALITNQGAVQIMDEFSIKYL